MRTQINPKRLGLMAVSVLLVSVMGQSFADEGWQARHAVMTNTTPMSTQHVHYAGPEGRGPGGWGAHPGAGKACDSDNWRTTLSDEQREAIQKATLSLRKDTSEVIAQLRVARAELDLLTTKDPVDQSAINAKIDEISQFQNQLMKRQALHRQEIRKLLTEEQRLNFDAHKQHGPMDWHGVRHGDRV